MTHIPLYLSRLHLNLRSSRVRRDLASAYELHRTLLRAFPDGVGTDGLGRVLWRSDTDERGGAVSVLVQSELEPAWDKLLSHHPDYLNAEGGWDGPKEFNPAVHTGQRLRFRLRANPTVKRDGKRYGLYEEEEQTKWLARKGEPGGFAVLDALARDEGTVTGTTTDDKGQPHKLNLLAVRYDGVLAVRDPDRFRATLATGIGSAKGMGFGLLSLARDG